MAALIYEWEAFNIRWRLVHIPGAQGQLDTWQVERLNKDTLGDGRWDKDFSWEHHVATEKRTQHMVMASAIESLVRRDPVLDAAHRTGGWDAVSAILRKKA